VGLARGLEPDDDALVLRERLLRDLDELGHLHRSNQGPEESQMARPELRVVVLLRLFEFFFALQLVSRVQGLIFPQLHFSQLAFDARVEHLPQLRRRVVSLDLLRREGRLDDTNLRTCVRERATLQSPFALQV